MNVDLRPNPVLFDEALAIRVTGVARDTTVTLRARTVDDLGASWSSWAAFRSTRGGVVDCSTQAPLAGTYSGVDPTGLLWSMSSAAIEPSPYAKTTASVSSLTLSVEAGGQEAVASIDRRVLAPGVTRIPLRSQGLVGTFFRPASEEAAPAVIVLGGSEGGLSEARAALLASRGYAALALAYFRADTLPSTLSEIPLEYFGIALEWLRGQPGVNPRQVVALGASRGAELALLLGSIFPEISVVVGVAPSAVVFGSVTPSGTPEGPSWTMGGRPLPFLPQVSKAVEDSDSPEPIALAPSFQAALADQERVVRSAIAVERIRGPVLLLSGTDDQVWPSSVMAEMIVERLGTHHHPYSVHHFRAVGAGHLLRFPYLPTTVQHSRHAVSGKLFRYGGTPEINARAETAAWTEILTFLSRATSKSQRRLTTS